MLKFIALRAASLVLAVGVGLTSIFPPRALAQDFGHPGQAIHLVVGHPCCYTASWSIYIGRDKAFWKRYLPAGSTVDFEVVNAGPPVVSAMIAGKEQIGYLGDMPAIIAATKRPMADVRIVATTALAYDQCNILLVRPNAPTFAASADAVRWLAGKKVAVPRGSCADRFAQTILKRENVSPGAYTNQSIELITSDFRAGKLDAAVVWEPVASQLIDQGLARRVASGANYGLTDAAFVIMRGDLIDKRPDIVTDWLKAELAAETFMADPKNADEVVTILRKYVPAYAVTDLRSALYKRYPAAQGGTDIRMVEPFAFPPDVHALLDEASAFLHQIKAINVDRLSVEAIAAKPADAVLASENRKAPVGEIKAQD